ncbi:hypothetical protein [Photobacterium lutimaris]|uniref:Uncharacterized protein n=1 Tax=Photobacterium lutimaris TaxID=388278 RepID=A0A2T3IWX6_9GAMM|nr:hypothetical protein [Photobacterium lutimaris]PSU32995.1 hypothetical protein C9I99_15430 [Photobacterium lutimaris]TDR74018.1 hypothetical protein DFP78_10977 [Photobacterium lutimaris]
MIKKFVDSYHDSLRLQHDAETITTSYTIGIDKTVSLLAGTTSSAPLARYIPTFQYNGWHQSLQLCRVRMMTVGDCELIHDNHT